MRLPSGEARKTHKTISIVESFPAPVGGWNVRDALANMPLSDAITLKNFYPQTSDVEFRGGSAAHATGMTGNGKTLLVYNRVNGTNAMFCCTGSNIYDVSSAGAVGAGKLARTNGKHNWTMFDDGTNQWMIACSDAGADKPAYFDGTTWTAVDAVTTPALTGVTSSNLVYPLVFKDRLMFIETASMNVWYLASGAAGGALTKLDLGGDFPRGGFLMTIAKWTRDAGDGQDDIFVAISSEGEVTLYQGTDPVSATTWSKIGTFFIGNPIGRRCTVQYGPDLIVLTTMGIFPLSAALVAAEIDPKIAVSYKIENAYNAAARNYSAVYGWKPLLFPRYNAMIINVPIAEDGDHEQYVMNTITKAWCRFTEWDAEDFAVFNEELYFAKGTAVDKAWTGTDDKGANIEFEAKQAFSYFRRPGKDKHFTLYRPIFSVNGALAYLQGIDVDFGDRPLTGVATATVIAGAKWDTDKWDESFLAVEDQIIRRWKGVREWTGKCGAVKLKIATSQVFGKWMSNDVVFEIGDIL